MLISKMVGIFFFISFILLIFVHILKENMKSNFYILTIICLLCLTSCHKKRGDILLSGDIKHITASSLYLYGTNGSYDKIDTIPIINGHFSYHITTDTLSSAILLLNNNIEYPIFFDKGDKISIKGDVNKLPELEITGNSLNKDFDSFKKDVSQSNLIINYTNAFIPNPALESIAERFISKHTSSIVSVYLLYKFFVHQSTPNYSKIRQLIQELDKTLRNQPQIAELNDYSHRMNKTKMGAIAPDFSVPDVNHINVSRTSPQLQNKYILLTFWASWTNDRAQTTAQLRQLYQAFHTNPKFVMINVSLDTDKNDWKQSIKQDRLEGIQVCDFNGFNSPIVTQYGIKNIPAFFLIAPDGIILARDMTGSALQNQIAAALK